MNRFCISIFCTLLLLGSQLLQAQNALESLKTDLALGLDQDEIEELLKEKLGNPDLLNAALARLINGHSNEFDIKFKTFQEDQITSLGLEYALNLEKNSFSNTKNGINTTGFSGTLRSSGNIAFDADLNPADFMRSELDMGIFWSQGGVLKPKDSVETYNFLNDLTDVLVEIEDLNDLRRSPLWTNFDDALRLTPQHYVDFAMTGGYESDQKFIQSNLTFGALASYSVKSWDKRSALSRLNLLDWPFAFIRAITGVDTEISPRGSALPIFITGLDRVSPVNNEIREQILNGTEDYWRFRLETGYRTLVTQVSGTGIYFNLNLRYFKELAPVRSIEEAGLDENAFLVASITSSQGFYVSYSVGELPFDDSNEPIYAIGFQYNVPGF